METTGLEDEVRQDAQAAWRRYLEALDPFRPGLHRYCRRLTGDIWDAEDLISDTLLKGFGLLGSVNHAIARKEAYLLRVATNLWIDRQRRLAVEVAALGAEPPALAVAAGQENVARVRDAGTRLIGALAPQERAAVLLKDVFEMSLEEIAEVLSTTPGAVKSALRRGRTKLESPAPAKPRPAPDATVIDRFCSAYNARDLDGLLALMLDSAAIEMPGVDLEVGRTEFAKPHGWFWHNVYGAPGAPREKQPQSRWRRAEFQGEPLALVLSAVAAGEQLGSVMRFETEAGRIARIRVYAFCPDAVREVGEAFGLPVLAKWYSFPAMMRGLAAAMQPTAAEPA